MTNWFLDLTPPVQALLAGSFTWLVTAAGASLVFFAKSISRTFLNVMLGFAAGVMIAASVWSLLLPAIDLSEGTGLPVWFPAAVGFLLGGAFLRLSDFFLPHLHLGLPRQDAEGIETNWRRSTLLILAITLHNIPEGLAGWRRLRRGGPGHRRQPGHGWRSRRAVDRHWIAELP